MKQLTEKNAESLTDIIYNTLMQNPEYGLGEMNDCREAANDIVNEWIEKNDIAFDPDEVSPPAPAQQVREGMPENAEGFTKGEWKWKQTAGNNRYEHTVYADMWQNPICVLGIEDNGQVSPEEIKANAKLIASAPGMLEALKDCQHELTASMKRDSLSDFYKEEYIAPILSKVKAILTSIKL